MKKFKLIFLLMPALLMLAPPAQLLARQAEPKYEMGTFYMVLLVKNPNVKDDENSPEAGQQFQAHVKHIISLLESGKALLAGPFVDNNPIAGILITPAASADEARALEESDPVVKSGRLKIEVLKWWAAKGIMKSPAAPVQISEMTRYYFGMIRKGPNWTPEKTPETEKIQAGHMANINAMAKAGKLVIAGPFENGGQYAGVFIFKVANADEAKALSDEDPAVKAGRLVVDIHPWMIAKGSLP